MDVRVRNLKCIILGIACWREVTLKQHTTYKQLTGMSSSLRTPLMLNEMIVASAQCRSCDFVHDTLLLTHLQFVTTEFLNSIFSPAFSSMHFVHLLVICFPVLRSVDPRDLLVPSVRLTWYITICFCRL